MWELLNQLYKRFGAAALLGAALLAAVVWVVVHILTPPCETVSVFFRLVEYKKPCPIPPNNGRPPSECPQLRGEIEKPRAELKRERQVLRDMEKAANGGDPDAQHALPQQAKKVLDLEQNLARFAEDVRRRCEVR